MTQLFSERPCLLQELLKVALISTDPKKATSDLPLLGTLRCALQCLMSGSRMMPAQVWMQLCFGIVTNVLSAEGEQRVKDVGTNIQLEKVACKWNLQDCVVGNPC
jgi:hypothetical protein